MHRGIERDLELLREYSQKPEASRLDIARRVACVVAWFIRDWDMRELCIIGKDAEALEQYVRDHADEAEGERTSTGRVLAEVLIHEYLFDDYTRIKKREQHMAFASEVDG